MASRFLHLLSEERLDPEAVTNRLSLSASDNDLVRRRPHASRTRNHVAWVGLQQSMSVQGVRRDKAALSSGCEPHPATAPAGSNRSSHGGNEVAEAFD